MKHFNFFFFAFILFTSCQDKSVGNQNQKTLSKGILHFEKTSHDFGTIKEGDESIIYKFRFNNAGSEPLLITNVSSSCGCTSPNWTKEPIEPGGIGFVEAKYNSKGHPGVFNKSLTVFSNTADSLMGLFIAGNVIQGERSISGNYKDSLGNLMLDSRFLDFGTITNKESITREFKVYNSGNEILTFSKAQQLPDYFQIVLMPKSLPPHTEGKLRAVLNPKGIKGFGKFSETFSLPTNDNTDAVKKLYFGGIVTEYFPQLSETQISKAPKISIDRKINDFGKVKKGTLVSTHFIVKNEGKEDLLIRNVESSCYCTKAEIDKSVLKPGETGKMKVTYDSKESVQGPDTKSVAIYCNDPRNSVPVVVINTMVVL